MATVVADLKVLVADGVLTPAQAEVLRARSREAMLALVVNTLLAGGVIATAGGLVVLLGDALAVTVAGALFLGGGIAVLRRAAPVWRMFGQAAALIGAGMLIGGGVVEAQNRLSEQDAASLFALAGAVLAVLAGLWFARAVQGLGFVSGFLMLAGLGVHLAGAYGLAGVSDLGGPWRMALHLYAAALVAGAGWFTDVRLVTALAIAPFAQALDTSTGYFHAAYVFYSPEPTLSVLQMAVAVAVCVWIMRHRPDRDARHAGILAILAFVVGNLCMLVGSLWGDMVGSSFALAALEAEFSDWEAIEAGRVAFEARALHISEHVFAAVWAAGLAACAIWAARTHRRGLFNAAMTFGAIHAYTQAFESFGDQPLAWAVGGLAAIPLAWGLWRLNQRFA